MERPRKRPRQYQIGQIIPAEGWTAAFVNLDSGERSEVPLVVWALTRSESLPGYSPVVGVVVSGGGTELCEETDPGFLGYLPPLGAPGGELSRERTKALAATIMTDQQGRRGPRQA
jgi:hypothetical protein